MSYLSKKYDFLDKLNDEDKKFAYNMAIFVLEDPKRYHTKAKDMIQRLYNLNVGAVILKEGTLIGHAQSTSIIDKTRTTWFHSICSDIGYAFVGPYWNPPLVYSLGGKYYFIGYNMKPLKLLPFGNMGPYDKRHPIAYHDLTFYEDTNCYLLVNPQVNLQVKEDRKGLINSLHYPQYLKLQEKYPQYDGMFGADEVIIFPRAMKYISFNLNGEQRKLIKEKTSDSNGKGGYDWIENPMCADKGSQFNGKKVVVKCAH